LRLRPPPPRAATPNAQGIPIVLISTAYAQTAPAATAGAFDPSAFILPLVMVAAIYFMVIRPQMKRQKEHKSLIDALAKGDEIVTAGGMLGRVSKLGESYLHVEVANGTEIQIQRSAVVQVLPKGTFK
jgi:preprotein translocase subunit YajC